MRLFSFSFLCGVLLLVSLHALPGNGVLLSGAAMAVLAAVLFRPATPVLLGILCGFFWALIAAGSLLSFSVPEGTDGKIFRLHGEVLSIPEKTDAGTRFEFGVLPFGQKISVLWKRSKNIPELNPGDAFQLDLRLYRIHGLMNPGGRDSETDAFAKGMRARGVVIDSSSNHPLSHHSRFNRFRAKIFADIRRVLPESKTSCWIPALAVGERKNISQDRWEVLKRTGTNHLMAIAGLHLGFVSGWVFLLVNFLWKKSHRLCSRLPAGLAAAGSAFLAAAGYAALSGFDLPARRACLMIMAAILPLMLRRKVSFWQLYALALLGVLLLQPLSVLSSPFWLSFGSVALIGFGMGGRVAPSGFWWKYGRIQWIVTLGLLPLSVWLFQQYSLVSLAANAIAIPWMGFLILPFVITGSILLQISDVASGFFLQVADASLSGLWQVLSYLSKFSFAAVPLVSAHILQVLIAIAGVFILLLPKGFPGRFLGVLWCLPLLLPKGDVPLPGEAHVTLLDAGQGLSAVVQTAHHVLVYDTGPRYGRDKNTKNDAGENILTPFLRYSAIRHLDTLVVSHGDSDHAGGVSSLVSHFLPENIYTSEPERIPVKSSYCLRGQKWIWDGVRFEFLYPEMSDLHEGNNSSCVMKITAKNGQSVLMTGDIEKPAELKLLQHRADLASTVLVVPHHGSKTSGEPAFIEAVHPGVALIPVGWHNRYHFPHEAVMQRYRVRGVHLLQTADAGAIQFTLGQKYLTFSDWREAHGHFWHLL